MLVGFVEQVSVDLGASPYIATNRTQSLHAWSGSGGLGSVVAALVLTASRASVSAGSIGRTDSSAIRSVRACGDERVVVTVFAETRLAVRTQFCRHADRATLTVPDREQRWSGSARPHRSGLCVTSREMASNRDAQ